VVWYDQQRDITPFVLKAIQSRRPEVETGRGPRGLPVPK
jgi:hypothetical protein